MIFISFTLLGFNWLLPLAERTDKLIAQRLFLSLALAGSARASQIRHYVGIPEVGDVVCQPHSTMRLSLVSTDWNVVLRQSVVVHLDRFFEIPFIYSLSLQGKTQPARTLG